MKRLLIIILFGTAIGCSHSTRQILPPLYEEHYPIIVGIRSYDSKGGTDIDSVLTSILIGSDFAAGVLEEPFENVMVDIVLEIEEYNTSIEKSGFLPLRYEIESDMVMKMLHPNGDLIKRYSSKGRVEQRSLNPFARYSGDEVLCAELLTSIIDDIDEDFQKKEPEIVHSPWSDEKSFETETRLVYPTLTHLSRNGIYAKANIKGKVPPRRVTLNVVDSGGDSLLSHQLFYETTRNLNGSREWLYQLHLNDISMPFSRNIGYEIVSIDAMEEKDALAMGRLQTISNGMFRLKQVEVIAHGTIITAFGGLMIVMMMYAI